MKKDFNQKKNINFLKKSNEIYTIYIQSTCNNTIVTLTDSKGNTLSWMSSGRIGFKNSRKSTVYAGQALGEKMANFAINQGYSRVNVKISGTGRGKSSCLRALYKNGLIVTSIIDTTAIPHNGCRPPKKRRI